MKQRRVFPAVALAMLFTASAAARADDRGRTLFEPCRACHSLDPDQVPMAGPNLHGLLDRRVGADPAFDYSPALQHAKAKGQRWTRALLDRFLADPQATFPGTWMTPQGLASAAERDALIEFLSDPASR